MVLNVYIYYDVIPTKRSAWRNLNADPLTEVTLSMTERLRMTNGERDPSTSSSVKTPDSLPLRHLPAGRQGQALRMTVGVEDDKT